MVQDPRASRYRDAAILQSGFPTTYRRPRFRYELPRSAYFGNPFFVTPANKEMSGRLLQPAKNTLILGLQCVSET